MTFQALIIKIKPSQIDEMVQKRVETKNESLKFLKMFVFQPYYEKQFLGMQTVYFIIMVDYGKYFIRFWLKKSKFRWL